MKNMKKEVLSMILVATPLLATSTTYADTPADHLNDTQYGTLEERANLPVTIFDSNDNIISDKQIYPKYIVATFGTLNGGNSKIDSSVYVGYKHSNGHHVKVLQAALNVLGYKAYCRWNFWF
jgi:hypothetical protein